MKKKSKWFKENGSLSEEGERAFIEIRDEVDNFLGHDEVLYMSISELQILGSCIAKFVADRIHDKIIHRHRIANEFEAMTDDEFYDYLKEKYGEHIWQFCSLTPEELARCPTSSLEDFEKIMQENAKNFQFQQPNKIGGTQYF
ncbi:unnamed protein product [Sphagnum balticum]